MNFKTVMGVLLILAMAGAYCAVMAWEYENGFGAFDNYVREGVYTFDTIKDSPDGTRVLISTGNCIFTVGQDYAWVKANTPYKVKWIITGEKPLLTLELIGIGIIS